MAILTLKHIHKSYGKRTIIDDFSFCFEANKIYAITGPSGCGKTTLLNIMGLLEQKEKGSISYGEIENPSLKSKQAMQLLRNDISYLFQNYACLFIHI